MILCLLAWIAIGVTLVGAVGLAWLGIRRIWGL